MRNLLLALFIAFPSHASATSLVMTVDALSGALTEAAESSSDGTSSTSGSDDKIILGSRDDASAYVGSDGEIVGVRLESAFMHIRAQTNDGWSEMEMARAVLGY